MDDRIQINTVLIPQEPKSHTTYITTDGKVYGEANKARRHQEYLDDPQNYNPVESDRYKPEFAHYNNDHAMRCPAQHGGYCACAFD